MKHDIPPTLAAALVEIEKRFGGKALDEMTPEKQREAAVPKTTSVGNGTRINWNDRSKLPAYKYTPF